MISYHISNSEIYKQIKGKLALGVVWTLSYTISKDELIPSMGFRVVRHTSVWAQGFAQDSRDAALVWFIQLLWQDLWNPQESGSGFRQHLLLHKWHLGTESGLGHVCLSSKMDKSKFYLETPLILLPASHWTVNPAALVAIRLVDIWSDRISILTEQNENSNRLRWYAGIEHSLAFFKIMWPRLSETKEVDQQIERVYWTSSDTVASYNPI